ncbi:natural killer cells antigen CD94-like [Sorex araneus]|uniref:natural killer cells antigen CD94-like n=1 Tax=Sorex araneus TaxID=42254 RepID=UPI0024337222|nr:natural killer cells antigen CD94-like [Sorex araneus]
MAASRTTQWRWISGILGILCLLLLTLLGVLLSKAYLSQSSKSTNSTGITADSQEGYPSCCSCPEGWIGYQCSCYFISKEQKSWEASRNFCESKNSSLLQMYSKEELHFLRYSRNIYWIGVSYNKDLGAWLWLNGSAVSLDLYLSMLLLDSFTSS